MGFYVNPPDMTKEEWLAKEAKPVTDLFVDYASVPKDMALVCLVQNAFFTAAGIVISQCDFEEFSAKGDRRPKSWFIVEREKLYGVSEVTPEWFA